MSSPTFFDLRLPLGYLFALLGALLILASFVVPAEESARPLGIDINLLWGGVLIAFGMVCLFLAKRQARRGATTLPNSAAPLQVHLNAPERTKSRHANERESSVEEARPQKESAHQVIEEKQGRREGRRETGWPKVSEPGR